MVKKSAVIKFLISMDADDELFHYPVNEKIQSIQDVSLAHDLRTTFEMKPI